MRMLVAALFFGIATYARLGAQQQTQEICQGSQVPAGWITVNDLWNPQKCGRPTSIIYNVHVIEKYSGKPVGAEMLVCNYAPEPMGWTTVDRKWQPQACGHPTSQILNVKRIKRLN